MELWFAETSSPIPSLYHHSVQTVEHPEDYTCIYILHWYPPYYLDTVAAETTEFMSVI